MPFVKNELATNAKGGTELMIEGLQAHLVELGHSNLLDYFDIYPSRVRNFSSSRPSIYWAHDLIGDPECDHLMEDKGARFAALIFVSDWQYIQFLNHYKLTGENAAVIYNAIEPIAIEQDKWTAAPLGTVENPIRLIYHTTPHRGLNILVPVYEALWKRYQEKNIHLVLDVYSSFSIYGWEGRDEMYKELFDKIIEHPGMNYHGAVPNDEIRTALQSAHIFAYPSIWQETSCLASIEAMSAQCIIVHSNFGALPETTGNLSFSYPMQASLQDNAARFFSTLDGSIDMIVSNPSSIKNLSTLAKTRADALYSWNSVVPQWVNTLSFLQTRVAS